MSSALNCCSVILEKLVSVRTAKTSEEVLANVTVPDNESYISLQVWKYSPWTQCWHRAGMHACDWVLLFNVRTSCLSLCFSTSVISQQQKEILIRNFCNAFFSFHPLDFCPWIFSAVPMPQALSTIWWLHGALLSGVHFGWNRIHGGRKAEQRRAALKENWLTRRSMWKQMRSTWDFGWKVVHPFSAH